MWKKIYKVGILDTNEPYQRYAVVDGKSRPISFCPFQRKWRSTVARCYSESLHNIRKTYEDCYMCDEWLYFSNFKRWMETQDWEGKHLDKDILFFGNKVYSPDTCVFIHPLINTFVLDCASHRGEYMVGVTFNKFHNKLQAQCQDPFSRKRGHLGYFTDELEAHLAWKARKHELSCMLADSEYVTDERVANALRVRYLNDFTNK